VEFLELILAVFGCILWSFLGFFGVVLGAFEGRFWVPLKAVLGAFEGRFGVRSGAVGGLIGGCSKPVEKYFLKKITAKCSYSKKKTYLCILYFNREIKNLINY